MAAERSKLLKSHILNICVLAVVILASACSKADADGVQLATTSEVEPLVGKDAYSDETKITVFLLETCRCCKSWISYLEDRGLEVTTTHTSDIWSVKERYQIPRDMVACHTAIVGNYFIEGHVPIEAIERLLTEKPDADGIALPGMPSGSPGMSGLQTKPLKIYSLSNGVPMEFMLVSKPG
jgi:hypothetical protein